MKGQPTKASADHAAPFSVKNFQSSDALACDHPYTSLLMVRSPGVTWVIDHTLVEGFESTLQKRPCLRAETPLQRAGTGKPLFKASEGGQIDILREWKDITEAELQQGSGT